MRQVILTILFISSLSFGFSQEISLPKGFRIELTAENLSGISQICFAGDKTLFAGSTEGHIFKIDLETQKTEIILMELENPTGVAFMDGDLYIADTSKILKVPSILESTSHSVEIYLSGLPYDSRYPDRYLKAGPDKALYLGIPSPCNSCLRGDQRYATILRIKNSEYTPFAKGIRNTQGFDWSPNGRYLYFSDNGRSGLKKELQLDEINRITTREQHFGYPYIFGKSGEDPIFGGLRPPDLYLTPPLLELDKVAPRGMTFYRGKAFPEEYSNGLFLAEYGNLENQEAAGFAVTFLKLNASGKLEYSQFATGWYQEGEILGRPVDIVSHPEGSLFISDTYSGKLYRIYYIEQENGGE